MRARLSCILAVLGAASLAGAQVSVLTRSYDNSRVGANLAESTLTPSNVRPNTFGKLFERVVDGQVYGQPLYVPNLTIPGKGTHNVIFCGTMNDSVYAFDADDPSASQPLWKTSFLSAGVTPVPYTDVATQKDVHPVVGIVSTPVIKLANGGGTIYVTAKTKEIVNGVATYAYRLHALDILTGAERSGSPVLISPSVPSTASDSKNGILKFDPKKHMQRPGLLLLNNVVYAAFASHTDRAPYHGWIVGYNADTLQQAAVYCATANTGYGGIWQSGQGLSADAQGNIYGITANGAYSPAQGSYGDTFFKLSTASGLSLIDSFTPFNEADLAAADDDLGCTGAINIPGTNLEVGGGKEGKIYVIDRNNMGGKTSDDSQIVQSWLACKGHIHGSPVFWSGPTGQLMYIWSEYDKLKAYRFSGGLFNTTPAYQSAVTAPNGMAGGHLTVSANGGSSGIVWASLPLVGDANHDTVPGVVRAFDASNLTEIWNSRMVPERDDVGYHAKFDPPIVANGKMYLSTFGADDGSTPHKIVCYGLLPPPSAPPLAPAGLAAQAGNSQVSLSWTRSAGASSYKLLRSASFGVAPAVIRTGITSTSALDTGVSNGTTYYYAVVATNSMGDSAPSNQAAATPGTLTAIARVNSGSGAFAPFAADAFFTGGKARVMATQVDSSGVLNPGPADIYRSERYGPCSYTFSSLTAGATYLVRLHFAEIYWTSPGQRLIDVSINGSPVLPAFDIIATTGGAYRAVVREFAVQADSSGQIAVAFGANANSPDVSPKVSGVELLTSNGAPGATTLLASPGNGSVGLYWPLVPGATGYNVYRGTTSLNEEPTPIASQVPGPSFADTNVSNGTTYYYVIRAVGPGGTSPRSNEASATPSSSSGFSVGVSAPQVTIGAGSTGNVGVNVTAFNGFSGVVSFSVSGLPAGCNAGSAPTSVTGSGASTLTISVGGSVPSGTYPLTVKGTSSTGTATAPLSLIVPDGALAPPTGVVATAANARVFLTWEPVPGAESYNVRRSTNSKGPFDPIANVPGTSATDPNVVNGVRYYYAITALNGSGESGLSTVVTAMPRSQLTVVPSADAYVQAGTSQNANFGSASTLLVKRASNTSTNGLNRCVYLRLDLTGVTTDPTSATLVLPIDAASTPDGSSATIKTYFLGNPAWNESTITWANAPGLDRTNFSSTGSLASSATVALSGTTATFDLTALVAANKGQIITLQLMNLNLDGTLTAFGSKEGSVQPQLRIKWAAP